MRYAVTVAVVVVLYFSILALCDKVYEAGKYFETVRACHPMDKNCPCGENRNITCPAGMFCAIMKGYREPRR